MIKTNRTGKLISKEDLRGKKVQTDLDITELINSLLFSKIVQGRTDYIQLAIIGRPSSGKSFLISSLVALGLEIYTDMVNVVYCSSMLIAVDQMDDRPVQMVILDDASGEASSRQAGKNVDSIQAMNTLRHRHEDLQKNAGNKYHGGLVIFVVAWQRTNDLDRAMRQSDITIYKTAPVVIDERMELEAQIGRRMMYRLLEITRRILTKEQGIKSVNVGVITALGLEGGGVGLYRIDPSKKYKLPRLESADEYFARKAAEQKAAAEAAKAQQEALEASEAPEVQEVSVVPDPGAAPMPAPIRKRVDSEIVITLYEGGMQPAEIARRLGVARSTVSRKLQAAGVLSGGDLPD